MSISSLAGSTYSLLRASPFVLDAVTASGAGHTPNRQPIVPCSVQVKVLAAGSVVVSGVVDGSSSSETLAFSAAGYRSTARRFSSITSITPSGAMIGTQIEAKALGADGSPQPRMLAAVVSGWLGAFTPGAPRWAARKEAQTEKREAMIAFDWRSDIEPIHQDFLLDETTGERWLIQGTNLLRGGRMPHHWEVHVSLWDGEAPG